MKIIHTSDLHLDSTHVERWNALDDIIRKCTDEKVDYLVIVGDIFDDIDSPIENLTKLRDKLANIPFKVILIPGNHDFVLFENERDLGDNVIILTGSRNPYYDDSFKIQFLSVPYVSGVNNLYFYEKLMFLRSNLRKGYYSVLVYHGDLKEILERVRYNKERGGLEPESTFSISLKDFQRFPEVSLVLAGHYHTAGEVLQFPFDNNKYFIYSGSPVSITKGDIGLRYIYKLEIDTENVKIMKLERHKLDTFYYERLEIKLAGTEDDPLNSFVMMELEKGLSSDPNRVLILSVSGFINSQVSKLTEREFKEKIREAVEKIGNHRVILDGDRWFNVMDVAYLLEKPYSKSIMTKIDEISDLSSEEKEALKELFINALSKVLATGKR